MSDDLINRLRVLATNGPASLGCGRTIQRAIARIAELEKALRPYGDIDRFRGRISELEAEVARLKGSAPVSGGERHEMRPEMAARTPAPAAIVEIVADAMAKFAEPLLQRNTEAHFSWLHRQVLAEVVVAAITPLIEARVREECARVCEEAKLLGRSDGWLAACDQIRLTIRDQGGRDAG